MLVERRAEEASLKLENRPIESRDSAWGPYAQRHSRAMAKFCQHGAREVARVSHAMQHGRATLRLP